MLISVNSSYKGLTMDRILRRGPRTRSPAPDPLDAFFDLLNRGRGSVSTVYDHHTEKDMNLALSQPWCSIGSDGLAYATEGPLRRRPSHPRSFGTSTRPRSYVRQKGLLRLEEAVRKMTSQNATKARPANAACLLRPGQLCRHHAASIRIGSSTVPPYIDPFQYTKESSTSW